MIRRALLGAAVAGLALGLVPIRPAVAAEPVNITIAVSSNTLAYGGLRIAEGASLFQKNGLNPKITVMESGNAAISAVLGGSAEFSSSGPGEVLAARVRGQRMIIVANVYRGLSGSVVLAKSIAEKLGEAGKQGLSAKIKALDGLVIAAPSATSAYLTPIKSAAEEQGARPKFVYMSQPAMVAALQSGAIQGMIAGAPFSLAPVKSGAGVVWLNGPHGELPKDVLPASSACLQTSEAYAAGHQEVVAALQKTFADLAAFIRQRPDEARAILAKAYPLLDPASLAAIFEQESPNWSQPVMTPADIAQEIAIQRKSGGLKGVEEVDPTAVIAVPKT